MGKQPTRSEAFAKDMDFYTDDDEETNCIGVFGTETGFCYGLHFDQGKADYQASDLRRQKDLANQEKQALTPLALATLFE